MADPKAIKRRGEPNWNVILWEWTPRLIAKALQDAMREGAPSAHFGGSVGQVDITRTEANRIKILHQYRDRVKTYIPPIDWDRFKASDKPMLECPATDKPAAILYFMHGFCFSKVAWRKSSFRQQVRDSWRRDWALEILSQDTVDEALRQDALDTLEVTGGGEDAEAIRIVAEIRGRKLAAARRVSARKGAVRRREARKGERSAARRRMRRRLDKQTLGVWEGIRGAKAAGLLTRPKVVTALGWDFRTLEGMQSATRITGPLEALDTPVAALEAFVRIDLRLLLREGKATLERNTLEVLIWDAPQGPGRLVVGAELKGEPRWISLVWQTPEGRFIQTIWITVRTIGGRERAVFICPVTGSAVEVIAFRNNRFASARGQKLTHASQMTR